MRTDGAVVVALEGGPHSEATWEWGIAEAVRRGAQVKIVRAVEDNLPVSVWSWYPIIGMSDLDVDVSAYLAETRARAQQRHPGMSVDARLLRGQVVPCLQEASADAQLLVVGARAGSTTDRGRRVRSGTTGAHVAAHARCPVAVVRSDPEHPEQPDAPVVVGVDGSPASLAAARLAAREARLRGVRLTVAHARPTIPDPFGHGSVPPLATEDENDPTHKAAQVVAQALQRENPGLTVEVALVDDEPADGLTGLARGAALLVVGSRGLGSFRGMLLGSVSGAVVREADCPVLVVHDHG